MLTSKRFVPMLKNRPNRRSTSPSQGNWTEPRGSALIVADELRQSVSTLFEHDGTVQLRVIGRPESRREFTANRIWYGNWNVPVSLKSCSRPPLTPVPLISLFGLLTLENCWLMCWNV